MKSNIQKKSIMPTRSILLACIVYLASSSGNIAAIAVGASAVKNPTSQSSVPAKPVVPQTPTKTFSQQASEFASSAKQAILQAPQTISAAAKSAYTSTSSALGYKPTTPSQASGLNITANKSQQATIATLKNPTYSSMPAGLSFAISASDKVNSAISSMQSSLAKASQSAQTYLAQTGKYVYDTATEFSNNLQDQMTQKSSSGSNPAPRTTVGTIASAVYHTPGALVRTARTTSVDGIDTQLATGNFVTTGINSLTNSPQKSSSIQYTALDTVDNSSLTFNNPSVSSAKNVTPPTRTNSFVLPQQKAPNSKIPLTQQTSGSLNLGTNNQSTSSSQGFTLNDLNALD